MNNKIFKRDSQATTTKNEFKNKLYLMKIFFQY